MAGRTVLGGGGKTREEDCSMSSRLGQALWIGSTTCAGLWVESAGPHLLVLFLFCVRNESVCFIVCGEKQK